MENGMRSTKVTDPAILDQLNGNSDAVTDPALLAQLNGEPQQEEDAGTYLDNLPKEPGFLSKLPRNILAGLASGGHTTINTPYNLMQMLENHVGTIKPKPDISLPKELRDALESDQPKNHQPIKLSEYIPHQQEYNFAQMLGQKGEGTMMDKLIQKGVEYAPEILSGKALVRGGFRRLTGKHQLDTMRKLVNESNIAVPLPKNLSDEARNFLPKTHATREMLAGAESGHFPSSFATQSQIGTHQRNLAKSPMASERLIAPEVGDLKQDMLNHYDDVFRNAGRHDIADMMRSGINNYRGYKKFMDFVTPIAKKLKIPLSGLAVLGLGFTGGKKLVNKISD
jgi:hypothetical protein